MDRLLRDMHCPRWLLVASWLWSILIVYSTMLIKQHVMWDVVAGAALAVVWGFAYYKFEDQLKGEQGLGLRLAPNEAC